MTTGAFLLYLLTLASTASIWLVGRLLLNLLKMPVTKWIDLFLSLVCGLSLLVSVYAAWATSGQTVILLLPLFLCIALYYYRSMVFKNDVVLLPTSHIELQPSLWQQAGLLLLATTFFFVVRMAFHSALPGQITTTLQDIIFYSKTTYNLNIKGVETQVINPLAGIVRSPQPYHYFDLWANALLAKITDVPALLLLDTIVYAVLLTMFFVGFVAVYAKFLDKYLFVIILAICSVFTCGTYWPAFGHSFLQGFLVHTSLLPMYPKLLPVAIFLLLGFHFVLLGKHAAAAWVWAAIAMVYTVAAPAVCLGGGGFAIYQLWRRKLNWITFISSLGAYGAVSLWVGSFYFLSGRHMPNSASYAPSYLSYLPKPNELKVFVNYFIGLSISQVAFYFVNLMVIGLLVVVGRKSVKDFWQQTESVVVAIILFTLAGVMAGTLLKKATDGYQLWMNMLLPIAIVGTSVLMAVALHYVRTKYFYWASATMLLLLAYNLHLVTTYPFYPEQAITHHNLAFVNQVADVEPKLSEVGAMLLGDADYNSIFSLNSSISTIGTYLPLVRDNATLVSLSTTQFDKSNIHLPFEGDTALARHLVVSEPLTKFVRSERQAGQYQSLPTSQLAFLQHNHINFICASPAAVLPTEIQPLVQRVLTDSLSGQKLYLLSIPASKTSAVEHEQHVRWMW